LAVKAVFYINATFLEPHNKAEKAKQKRGYGETFFSFISNIEGISHVFTDQNFSSDTSTP